MVNMENEDFRTELYKEYVSTFKKTLSQDFTADLISYEKKFKRIYLPLLKDFKKDAAIIEVGCGPGNVMQFLKNAGFDNIFGIDISDEQIKEAADKNLNAASVNVFEFFEKNKNKYDVIFALDFVEHFHRHELLKLFKGFNRLLNDNGILVIRTPNGSGLFPNKNIYGDLTHLTIFNQYSLIQILQITNFYNINFYENPPISKNFYGFVRSILWRCIKLFVRFIRIVEVGSSQKILTQDLICTARKKTM